MLQPIALGIAAILFILGIISLQIASAGKPSRLAFGGLLALFLLNSLISAIVALAAVNGMH